MGPLPSRRQTVCVLAAAARRLIPDPSGRCTTYYECANLMDQGSAPSKRVDADPVELIF